MVPEPLNARVRSLYGLLPRLRAEVSNQMDGASYVDGCLGGKLRH
jgi:hypothetical protein